MEADIISILHEGHRKNRVQTSLTLTQEDENNCTLVIPVFHRVIDWWGDVLSRGQGAEHQGNTMRTNDVYTAEDVKNYGNIGALRVWIWRHGMLFCLFDAHDSKLAFGFASLERCDQPRLLL